MGAFLSVDETQKLLYIRFEGEVTDEVFLSRYRQVLEWNAAEKYELSVTDLTGIVSSSVSSQAVRAAAERVPVIPGERRRTIVVAPNDMDFGLSRMFEMLRSAGREQFHVVRSMAEAYKLLGVESLELKTVMEW